MTGQRHLGTERLILRPFAMTDAADVQRLAGEREIALNTLTIPHPYPDGAAEAWIAKHAESVVAGKDVTYAITSRETGELLGAIGLRLERDHDRAEIGYWIGKPYWGRGYAAEAAIALITFGFSDLRLNRIYAAHFTRNPASGSVMRKAGMVYEGRLRQHDKKWDECLDVEMYAVLREDWPASRATTT